MTRWQHIHAVACKITKLLFIGRQIVLVSFRESQHGRRVWQNVAKTRLRCLPFVSCHSCANVAVATITFSFCTKYVLSLPINRQGGIIILQETMYEESSPKHNRNSMRVLWIQNSNSDPSVNVHNQKYVAYLTNAPTTLTTSTTCSSATTTSLIVIIPIIDRTRYNIIFHISTILVAVTDVRLASLESDILMSRHRVRHCCCTIIYCHVTDRVHRGSRITNADAGDH